MQNVSDLYNIDLLRTSDIPEGSTVLVRADFNVPIIDGGVGDSFRIYQTLPTLTFLKDRGCTVVVISHIENDVGSTLKPVSSFLQEHIPHTFVPSLDEKEVKETIDSQGPGDVILLENVRSEPGEKENNVAFAEKLASCADVYVNDAFSASHRAHASLVGVPKLLPSYAGLRLEKEIGRLSNIFKEPPRPFVFVLGGAKFETKLPLIEKFLERADSVFVGGALANDVYLARGYEIGRSRVSKGVDVSDIASHEKLSLSNDVIVEAADGESHEKEIGDVASDERILDMGPRGVEEIVETTRSAKLVVWNGPLGDYEHCYGEGTRELARGLADQEEPEVIIGGGDTLAVINDIGLQNAFSFISTGGGAMLEFLSQETLPGITALSRAD